MGNYIKEFFYPIGKNYVEDELNKNPNLSNYIEEYPMNQT